MKHEYLGAFIKNVNEVWRKALNYYQLENDPRRSIAVQARVLQCLEEPFRLTEWLSSIYKAPQHEVNNGQLENEDGN